MASTSSHESRVDTEYSDCRRGGVHTTDQNYRSKAGHTVAADSRPHLTVAYSNANANPNHKGGANKPTLKHLTGPGIQRRSSLQTTWKPANTYQTILYGVI